MLLTIQNVYTEVIKKCQIQPTLINLHPNEYNQKLHYYPFAVKLGNCVGSCNTLNNLPKISKQIYK